MHQVAPFGWLEGAIFLVVAVIGVAMWAWRAGRRSAGSEIPKSEWRGGYEPARIVVPPVFPRCSRCDNPTSPLIHSTITPTRRLCEGCFAFEEPAAWHLLHPDTPSRDTNHTNKPSATG